MATPAENFQKMAFGGRAFPISNIRIRGSSRHVIHEYPHIQGGSTEKLGRRLYSIEVAAHFHDLPDTDFAADYPSLYPDTLNYLQRLFEAETTTDLVIPNIGTIKAFATDWDREFDFAKALSGEECRITFLEDQDFIFLGKSASFTPATVRVANDDLQARARLAAFNSQESLSIFQAINDAVTAVQAIQGQADAYSQLAESKILAIANLCGQADATLTELQSPVNHQVINALKELWSAAIDLAENVTGTGATVRTYTVPMLMGVGQIATNIYGDAERGGEILQLNEFADPFQVPAGRDVRYLDSGALQGVRV